MEIRVYFQPLIKWWKLILFACLLAGISAFLLVRRQPPIYQTQTTLVIGRAVYEANPSFGEIGITTQLATYYSNIALREVVRTSTMEALGLNWLPGYTAHVLPNSQLIEIIVTDTDPQRAMLVANELANQLIKQTPSNPELQEAKNQQFIEEQLELLQTQIKATIEEIANKEEELGGLNSAREIASTQQEISILNQKMLTLQTNYASLLGSSTGKALNSLTVVESAGVPTRPVGPNQSLIILMSVAIAFVISAGAAYLIEYLDDTFKTPEDVTRGLKLPVLGYVTRLEKEEEGGFIVTKDPDSPISEAFRSMSLNLEFIDVDKQQKTVLISSVGPEEGKTFIAANLAMTMAQIGRKVILLEGDLRRPSVHQVLNEPNVNGLSEVIRGECSIEDVAYSLENGLLKVITAGGEVPNPSNALGSKKMDGILYYLRSQADIIIIDGPPMLVSDSKVLANKVDLMLLVVRYAKTRKGIAQEALEQMDQVGTKIAGVVMNDLPKDQGHYGVYRYYSRKEGSEKPPATASKNGLKIPWLKGAFETLSAKIEQGGKNLRAK